MHFLQSLIDFVLGLDESLSNLSHFISVDSTFFDESLKKFSEVHSSDASGATSEPRSLWFRSERTEIFNSRLKSRTDRVLI